MDKFNNKLKLTRKKAKKVKPLAILRSWGKQAQNRVMLRNNGQSMVDRGRHHKIPHAL
jgi:hypothetical protein